MFEVLSWSYRFIYSFNRDFTGLDGAAAEYPHMPDISPLLNLILIILNFLIAYYEPMTMRLSYGVGLASAYMLSRLVRQTFNWMQLPNDDIVYMLQTGLIILYRLSRSTA